MSSFEFVVVVFTFIFRRACLGMRLLLDHTYNNKNNNCRSSRLLDPTRILPLVYDFLIFLLKSWGKKATKSLPYNIYICSAGAKCEMSEVSQEIRNVQLEILHFPNSLNPSILEFITSEQIAQHHWSLTSSTVAEVSFSKPSP